MNQNEIKLLTIKSKHMWVMCDILNILSHPSVLNKTSLKFAFE